MAPVPYETLMPMIGGKVSRRASERRSLMVLTSNEKDALMILKGFEDSLPNDAFDENHK